LLAPLECSFAHHIWGDFWGEWKVTLDASKYSPDAQKLLTKVGVFPGEPEEWMTIDFFRWLNGQDSEIVGRHLACIIKHINKNLSPDTWKVSQANLNCIPVLNGDGYVELKSISAVTGKHSQVYIDDYFQLGDRIRNSFGQHSVCIVIDSHKDIRGPITDKLKRLGLKSLRAIAVNPDRVEGIGNVKPAGELHAILERLSSARMEREFKKRLVSFDIDINLYPITRVWAHKLRQIDQVMWTDQVFETVKLGRDIFRFETGAGLDRDTQNLYVKHPPDSNHTSFFQVMANIIFKKPMRFLASNLQSILMFEFREISADLSLGKPNKISPEAPTDPEIGIGGDADTENPQSLTPHEFSPAESGANIPKPGDLTPTARTNLKRKRGASGVHGKKYGDQRNRIQSEVEKEAIFKLKNEHYAFHCQICLANHAVSTLAPEESYVEQVMNRRKILEAHHTHHDHAGGAGHAGNLLILCHQHHHEFGDKLSRAMITNALKEEKSWKEIEFKALGESKVIKGRIIDLYLPAKEEYLEIFFTQQHADIWLELAG
ncbi:MAG: hypothetical protein HOD37_10590, partial [Bacteroidetes bacterium]|nr:hypothetical protein [Bacteroidota bacterium]